MPPKTKKELEQEAQKLLEEQKKKEEEDRIRKEEERKFGAQQLETGLSLVLNPYYVTECLSQTDPQTFTREFIERHFNKLEITKNFRKIDWDVLIDFHMYNIRFAQNELHLKIESISVFINIMWQVLQYDDPKYLKIQLKEGQTEAQGIEQLKVQMRSSQKSKEKDFDLLKQLFASHSVDEPPKRKKYFTSEQLKEILEYARTGYFAHHNLYNYVMKKDQKTIDTYQTVIVDEPQDIPKLSDALYVPIKKDDQENENLNQTKQTEVLEQEQQQAEQPPLEEEEPLDPASQEIINEKIKALQDDMAKQLQLREESLQNKYNTEVEKITKGGAKKK